MRHGGLTPGILPAWLQSIKMPALPARATHVESRGGGERPPDAL